jgi:hypothetical protein
MYHLKQLLLLLILASTLAGTVAADIWLWRLI